jgi:hypothetical protein
MFLYSVLGVSYAQQETVWPVYVDHTGDDFVGKQVMIRVNDALQKNTNYTRLDSASNGELGFFRIMITSVATTQIGDWSAISVVYTLELPDSPFGIYLNSAVYFRNKDTTVELSENILDQMNVAIDNYSIWRKAKDRTLGID